MLAYGGADVGLGNVEVERLHTNTQYLLGELGRLGLVQNFKKQRYLFTYTKGSKGSTKLNPLRTKPTPVL